LQAPSIVSHGASTTPLVYGSTVTINATTTNETTVYLGYRGNYQLKFNRVQMFDDGAHNDGAAGDHLYGADVPVSGLTFEYYIYAENNNAGLFSPARAEHEFHTLAVNFPTPAIGSILINEVLASNDSLLFDPNGEDEDWIELINTTNTPIDLAGFYLSDDPLDLMAWAFPAGTIIPANGYLLVWADNDVNQVGLHANFKLSSGGDYVYLSHGFNVHDQVAFGPQIPNISYARCPDAGLDFATIIPTPLANNNCNIGVQENEALQVQVYPNPFADQFTIESHEDNIQLNIRALSGQILYATTLQNGTYQIDARAWSSGMYIIELQSQKGVHTLKLVRN
jgi:hypothetical protein